MFHLIIQDQLDGSSVFKENNSMSKKFDLEKHTEIRRQNWALKDKYRVEKLSNHRFVASVCDELVGLSYAEINDDEAKMHMNLKNEYAEYGIGTELLYLLMNDLKESGFKIVRYEINRDRYAYQIYRNFLGFDVEEENDETVKFIWRA